VEREVGNQEPSLVKRTRDFLAEQKSPRIAAVCERESERVGQIGELVRVDVFEIARRIDAVANVLPPEPAIEPRNAARVVQLDEVVRNVVSRSDRENSAR